MPLRGPGMALEAGACTKPNESGQEKASLTNCGQHRDET